MLTEAGPDMTTQPGTNASARRSVRMVLPFPAHLSWAVRRCGVL